MAKIVVGLMDNRQEAEKVLQELVGNGFSRDDINIQADERERRGFERFARDIRGSDAHALTGIGVPDRDADNYAEGVRRGGFLITVTADDDEAGRALEIMRRSGAVDINRRAEQWRQESAAGYGEEAVPRATAGGKQEGTIPVVEEDVQVGKRQVETGGIRAYSRVTESPVEEQVTLREEHARVERRPTDRPATEADRDAFRERSFEVRETTEEPVISKQARVKEEVTIGAESSERTEQVRDTVRRTNVEVERTGQAPQGRETPEYTSADDTDFERHFRTNATPGERYESYRSAYHYAESRSGDPRFTGKEWNDVEEDVHRDWERSHPGTWAKVKEAIHYGWNKTRGH